MKNFSEILRLVTAVAAVGAVVFTAAKLPAGLDRKTVSTSVEIEGVDYGVFTSVEGLDESAGKSDQPLTVTLKRNFVTDQSLYSWANSLSKQRQGLKNVYLVRRNEAGDVVSPKYLLKLCQPLAWTVEAADPALGGFHETVELAVQGVVVE